jgi:large exoprotein involved in heme utilization and adhesion
LNTGGQVLTTTNSNSRAGNITVNIPDLQLAGATSGLFTETTSAGHAGDLTIQSGSNGQNLRVNLQDGARISASTRGSGDGGDLTITAPESIALTGNGSVIAAEKGGGGMGGNLTLRTGNLSIQNGAQVTVSSSNTGRAGSLFANADRIFLKNGGSIRADTSGGGGNINLRSPLIVLRNGSNISTNARGSNIPGGNITIDTQFLVAVPKEDSNISANSRDFRGGNVSINAYSIFGIQPRPQLTSWSDITATGATSALAGTLDVTTPAIDPTAGLVALPTDFVNASGLIAQGCPADKGNSFTITGRGGLPPTLEQQLDDDARWEDRRRLTVPQQTATRQDESNQHSHGSSHTLEGRTHTRTPIVEATGWQITPTGKVVLFANTSSPI